MAVGKSSLVLRFVKGQFDEFQETTIGGEAYVINLNWVHKDGYWYLGRFWLVYCIYIPIYIAILKFGLSNI